MKLTKKISAIIIVALMVMILASSMLYTKFNYTTNTSEVYISIDQGEGLRSISNKLKDKNIVSSSLYFILYTKLKGFEDRIQYGNYLLPPKIKLGHLLDRLQNPTRDYAVVTIPEGSTIDQIAKILEEDNLVNPEKLLNLQIEEMDAITSTVDLSNIYYSLEGYLFPDTYHIPVDYTEMDIAKIMFNQLEIVLKKHYSRIQELELSINEVLTIASLIEKEAANDKERSKISGVIYNRLSKGMPLQIDASVIYGITKGKESIQRVTYKDLESNTKFNTYQIKGLPPGPIASPGQASIEAALYPESHDYLYYVLGDDGHIFSKTYKEHLKNISKYRK